MLVRSMVPFRVAAMFFLAMHSMSLLHPLESADAVEIGAPSEFASSCSI